MDGAGLTRYFPTLKPATLGLIALLIAAFALRVYQLSWDEGRILHPDELHVIEVTATRISFEWPPDLDNLFDPSQSHLNPRSDDPTTGLPRQYAYGALPVLVTDLVATTLKAITGTDWTSYFNRLYKVGRVLSATFDTATVWIVFLLGCRLANRRVGLLGASMYALAPMAIQLSHFYTTDSWLTFFVALTLLFAIRAYDKPSFSRFAATGASCGMALATKGSVVTLLVMIGVTAVLVGWRQWRLGETLDETLWVVVSRLSVATLAVIVGFGIFEPYALARPAVYLGQLRIQSGIVRGTLDATYTRQYVGTVPLLYQVEQLFRWGIGPMTTLLTTGGVVVFLAKLRHRFDPPLLILGSWLLLQGLVVVLPETKFLRYIAPFLPALAVLGGMFLDTLRQRTRNRVGHRWSLVVVGAALAGVFVWTAGFSSVYAAPHTRLEASRWMYANVPNGSSIGVETWDDALPVPFGTGLTPWDYQYRTVPFDLYGDRPPSTVADDLYDSLSEADYVVLASNRVQRGVSQLPWRYPVQIRYYDLLDSGTLGFRLVAEFERYPGLGSLRLNDQSADESFINYDHPRVRIYEKDVLVSREIFDQLMAHAEDSPIQISRSDNDSLRLDEPVSDLPDVSDARWSGNLTDNSAIALLVWVMLLVLLQIVGLPLTRLAFGRFADAGWGFSRLVALLTAGYLVWIGASVKVLSFRAIWCWVALLIVAATWIVLGRRSRLGLRHPSSMQRRTAYTGEVVFWVVFVVFLTFRLFNPDSWHPFWGGEKPMEFAHLNAILRSAHFPPYDPWFADGYINYYYYGLYVVAFCIKLTGIPSEIAFNLAQPTMVALLASAGFGITSTLGRRLSPRPLFGPVAGIAGTILLVAIGNLEAFVQVVRSFPDRYEPGFALTWGASRVIPYTINEFPFFTGLYADLHAHVVALPITVLVIGLCYAVASEPRVVVIACSHGKYQRSARFTLGVRLGLLVLTLGALFPTNAWDVPVYAALTAVAIFMATRGWTGIAFRLSLSTLTVAVVGAGSYVLYLPFHSHYVALFGSVERVRSTTGLWPFLDHWGGLLVIVGFGLVVMLLASKGRTPLGLPFTVAPLCGLGLILVLALLSQGQSSRLFSFIGPAIVTVAMIQFAIVAQPDNATRSSQSRLTFTFLMLGTLGTVIALASDRLPLGLMIAFATGGIALWLRGSGPAAPFVGAMIAAGAGVAGGVEIVFLADDLVTIDWYRMNTVFKFYNQVWVLFAIVGGASIALMIDVATRPRPSHETAESQLTHSIATDVEAADAPIASAQPAPRSGADTRHLWSRIGLVASGCVVLASMAYPLLATKPRLDLRFEDRPSVGTLNAIAWMDDGTIPLLSGGTLQFADDRVAIDWMNDTIDGSPVIAEASIGPYRCNGSRFSIQTGLPTIIGWERHETQQRYPNGLAERVADVEDLYSSPDAAVKLDILRRYDVRYVIVGQLERVYPRIVNNDCRPTNPVEGIAAFDDLLGTSLEVAFQHGTTTIYRVLPPTA